MADAKQRFSLNRGGFVTWDITRAKAWVADQQRLAWPARHRPQELLEVTRDQLEHIATTFEIDEAFVEAADPSQPGIAAPIIDRDQTPPVIVYILIDGIHRATKAYRTGLRFAAVVLPDDVSRDCLLEAPPGVIP